jgi:hypothetical protein
MEMTKRDAAAVPARGREPVVDDTSPELHWRPERERRRPLFVDWVYFKFFAPRVQGVIVYGCACGLPGVLSVQIFRRNAGGQVVLPPTVILKQGYTSAESWRSLDSYDCRIADATLACTADGYAIRGAVADGASRISWDLRYARLAPLIESYAYRRFGWLGAGNIHWNVLAPLAAVAGTVEVEGAVVAVDGKGYADTNWGNWLFALDPTTHWNWAFAYDEEAAAKRAVVGMSFRRDPRRGALYFLDGATRISFPCDERSFVHRGFRRDAALGVDIPVLTQVHAANRDGYRLELTLANEDAYVYRQAIPPTEMRGPLPTPFEWALVENLITAEGTLEGPGGARTRFAGRGIKEYPVTRLCLHR